MTGTCYRSDRKRRVHVWTRALSLDQFEKIREVEWMRRSLDPEVVAATLFARCQIRDTGRWHKVSHRFDGSWEGEPVDFIATVRPLFMNYAARLYEAAAREALELFPGFTDHIVEDGPELGERRIVFTSGKQDLARCYMMGRIWRLADEGKFKVGESIRAEPAPLSYSRYGRRTLNLEVWFDRPVTDEVMSKEIEARLSRGESYPLDPTPRQCDMKLAAAMRAEMSLPELAYMNWEHARKPLTPADQALFKAVETFDRSTIAAALAQGADPNAIDEYGEPPLAQLANYDRWMYVATEKGETEEDLKARVPPVSTAERIACMEVLHRAGAHLDFTGPDGLTPLSSAVLAKHVEAVEWLLRMGADDTINCYGDSWPGAWPTAWDYASSDASIERTEAAEQTYRAFRRYRQGPDGKLPNDSPDW